MDPALINAILDGPALAPPKGVVPNFENPQNLRNPELAVLQLAAATVVVALRVYTKMVVVGKMLTEDYWLIIAWFCFAGFHVIVFMLEGLPLGVHQWDLTARRAIDHARLFHIGVAIYSLIIVPLKVSLILQIRRIFIPHSRSLHSRPLLLWVIDSFLALNVMFYITLFLFQFLACRPLAHAWNPLVEGKCVKDSLAVHIVSAGINTVSDLIIVVLPQPIIWRLELDRQKKWGLTAVFLLGAFACAASAVRLYYAALFHSSTDHTYRAAQMGKWAEPELTFGFLAACLPILPAFIKHLLRTRAGLKLRGLWTQSPPTAQGSSARQVKTVGSYGRSAGQGQAEGITKVVEMDIEFVELTRGSGSRCDGVGRSRDASRERDEEWEIASRGVELDDTMGAAQKFSHIVH